jgi:hypothetical protein
MISSAVGRTAGVDVDVVAKLVVELVSIVVVEATSPEQAAIDTAATTKK